VEIDGTRQREHLRKIWLVGIKEDMKSFALFQEDAQVGNGWRRKSRGSWLRVFLKNGC